VFSIQGLGVPVTVYALRLTVWAKRFGVQWLGCKVKGHGV
jgi:hypothetical protein